jgi:hypothetical protein
MYTENIKNRILMIIAAIAAYIFSPVLIGTSMFSFFNPVQFPFMGFVVHGIQVFVFLILLYGAFEWIKPSLIPKSIPKKLIGVIIGTIIAVSIIPAGVFTLESTGNCMIINHSQDGKVVTSTNGQSTERQCIDICIDAGDENVQFNQVSCEFTGIGESWSKTPEEFQGYKPKI